LQHIVRIAWTGTG